MDIALKKIRGYAEELERIYKISGVTDITVLEKIRMQAYIIQNNHMYGDIYNYTEFLNYDPQPLVSLITKE
ncbi:hypothetical protein [Acinetobacter courvalinii]|uniref:hypothetical protein n=1 Tax=Acinetobacter courvalinii TaxID=280147 RepID=UPI001D0E2570|nr:hypothetical protein [Acinetobacter courvalinii]